MLNMFLGAFSDNIVAGQISVIMLQEQDKKVKQRKMFIPIGSGNLRPLLSPSIPAATIAASPKCGFAHPSNDLISKLLTISTGTPGGHAVLNGASRFSFPQHR
jgi:hypothetical protein